MYEFTCQSRTGGLPENIITPYMSGFQIWALHVKMQRNGCQKTVKKVTMKWPCALGKEAAHGGSSQPHVLLHEQERPWEYNGLPVSQGKAGTVMPCWTAAISPAYGNTHGEGVTKFKPIMWITSQALLSRRVLSNAFEVSRSAICWTVRPQKRVRFPHVLKHVLNTAQCRCLVCSGNISCSGAVAAEEVPWRNKGRLSGGGSTVQWLGLPCAKLSTAPQGPWCTTALA